METGINRIYRDRLFRFIFGNEKYKECTLSLYNAVNNSNYTNPDDIELTIIEDVIYMGMKNDVSFLIGDTINLYEQQSTYNPNMPVRFLIYLGMLYSKYINEMRDSCNLYSSSIQKLPTPKCVCFYNGKIQKKDVEVLRLSDAFNVNSVGDVELTVTMININHGHNKKLMDNSKPLLDYTLFIDTFNKCMQKFNNADMAIDMALYELDNISVIKEIILSNKAEVKCMCLTEYDEEKIMQLYAQENFEKGEESGMRKLCEAVKRGFMTLEQVSEISGYTAEELQKYF